MSLEEAIAAADRVRALWGALARDDDRALSNLESDGMLGGNRGFAGVIRKALHLSRRQCERMGVCEYVYLLTDGSYVVRSAKVDLIFKGGEPVVPILVKPFPGGWILDVRVDIEQCVIAEEFTLPLDA